MSPILRDALYIARMDARFMLRRRETIVWTFVMPVASLSISIGTITGNVSSNSRDPVAVSVPAATLDSWRLASDPTPAGSRLSRGPHQFSRGVGILQPAARNP